MVGFTKTGSGFSKETMKHMETLLSRKPKQLGQTGNLGQMWDNYGLVVHQMDKRPLMRNIYI